MSRTSELLVIVLLVTSMLAMGSALSLRDLLTRLRDPKPLAVALLSNLLVVPALAVAAVAVLPLDSSVGLGLALVAAAPGGGTGALLAMHARGDVAHAVTLQGILALASLISVPLWLAVFTASTATGSLDLGSVAVKLLAYQFLPLVVGMLQRTYWTRFAARVHGLMRALADLVLATLVIVLLFAYGDDIASTGPVTVVAILLIVGMTLAVGAAPFGTVAVRRATTMTTATRNLSMALLAATFASRPVPTTLTILGYGLVMYLMAFGAITVLRRRPDPSFGLQ